VLARPSAARGPSSPERLVIGLPASLRVITILSAAYFTDSLKERPLRTKKRGSSPLIDAIRKVPNIWPEAARAMLAPKRLAYPSPPWPYPSGLLMAWPKPAPTSAPPMVDNATLSLAASLNFCQGSSGPVPVARSGNISDLCCSTWKKDTLLCKAFLSLASGCACALVDGASGNLPDEASCATLPAHTRQKKAAIAAIRHMVALRLFPDTNSPRPK